MKQFLKQAGFKSLILLICVMCLSLGSVSGQMGTETILLADDFNDNSLDTTKWIANDVFSGYTDTTLPVSETNQHIEIGPLPLHTTGSSYNGIRSAGRYNLTNAYCYVEILQPANPLTVGAAMLTIGYDSDNYYRIYVQAGSLICQKKIGGVKTNVFTATYDSVNHKFVRICQDSATGDVIFETAAANEEAPGIWTQCYREEWNTASVPLEQVQFELKAGTWHTELDAPGTVIFDNFKVAARDMDSSISLSSLTLNPTSVTGGSPSQGTMTLSGAAPSGGAVVTLSSSNTNVATAPASVTISPGATSASFTVATSSVSAPTSVDVSANYNSVTKTATLIVTAPPPPPPPVELSSLTLEPSSVVGGSPSQGTVTLSGAAPSGGAVVTLSSSNTNVATVPASVTIAAGATSASFTVATSSVSASTSVTISASYNGKTKTATLTVTAPSSGGSALYVDPAGSDSNPGTLEEPFRTVARGASVLSPGSTLYVGAGTYAERLIDVIPSGTSWTIPVTIRALDPANRPVIEAPAGSGGTEGLVKFSGRHYIILDGLVLDGKNLISTVVYLSSGSGYVRLANGEIRNSVHSGIFDGFEPSNCMTCGHNEFVNLEVHHNGDPNNSLGYHGFYIQTSDNLIEGCDSHHNIGLGIQLYHEGAYTVHRNLIRNNRIHDNGKTGLLIGWGDANVAYNNLVWMNADGIRIDYGASNTGLYNNTVYRTTSTSGWGGISNGSSVTPVPIGSIIENNIVVLAATRGIRNTSTSGPIILNNLVYQSGISDIYDPAGTAILGGNITGQDPRFINALALDFHLQIGSPCIDTGLAISGLLFDFDGVFRPQGAGYDLGAYEWVP